MDISFKKDLPNLIFWMSELLHYNEAEMLKEWFITHKKNANYIDEVKSFQTNFLLAQLTAASGYFKTLSLMATINLLPTFSRSSS